VLVLSVVATGGSTPPVACTPRILTLEYALLPLLPTSHPASVLVEAIILLCIEQPVVWWCPRGYFFHGDDVRCDNYFCHRGFPEFAELDVHGVLGKSSSSR
jgi:hypothetical protein